jgi:hypothetical protein
MIINTALPFVRYSDIVLITNIMYYVLKQANTIRHKMYYYYFFIMMTGITAAK